MSGAILPWLLALLLPMAFVFVLSLTLGLIGHRGEERYSFLTMFPFELFHGTSNLSTFGRWLFYLYAVLDAFAGIFMLLTHEYHEGLTGMAVLYLIVLTLKDVALILVATIPAYQFKPHIFSFTFFGGTSVLGAVVACILFCNHAGIDPTLSIVFALLSGLLGLILLGLLLNPKLSHWAELHATVEADGAIVTSRPRPFVLAFTEWLMIFLAGICSVISLVGFALLALFHV